MKLDAEKEKSRMTEENQKRNKREKNPDDVAEDGEEEKINNKNMMKIERVVIVRKLPFHSGVDNQALW